MKLTEFASVPAIVIAVYLFAALLKQLTGSEKLQRAIPAICGGLGGILGLICYFTIPNFFPAENWLTALAQGIVSGFAATVVHQVYKQAAKGGETDA